MPKSLDEASVRHVAALARLQLSDDEVRRFAEQLTAVLHYFEQLEELDTAGVAPFTHPLALHNVLREDAIRPGLTADEALANAPDRSGDFFRVPKVLDQEDA